MGQTIALSVALAVFAAGLALKASRWFRDGLLPAPRSVPAWSRVAAALRGVASVVFSARILALLEALVLDVLLQRRLLRESPGRWLAHASVAGAFLGLLLMHALGAVITSRLFPGYASTLDPFLFLRDLFGAVLLAGLAAAVVRRRLARNPRLRTRPSDSWALAILATIAVSGVLLEAVKIGSRSRFEEMVREYGSPADEAPLRAFWAARMGTVAAVDDPSPELLARGQELHEASCATCHSPARSGFVAYAVAAALRPLSPRLDAARAPGALHAIHFYACLVGLALLPFTKMLHLAATPLSLVANAAAGRSGASPSPANAATRQMLELDACTHCCTCSTHCSMAAAADVTGNEEVLPAEKIAALKALASGRALAPAALRALQQGVCLCTSCDRCTVACPSGIDLLGLWTSAKEALLARGEPEYSLLSPLSLRRRLTTGERDPSAYLEAVERPRRTLADGFAEASDSAVALTPGDGRLWAALRTSVQAGTAASCFGCKTCTTACPVVRERADAQEALGLLPHQVLYAARLGLVPLVLGARMLWDCLGCYQCQELCPQGVGVTDVLYELKNVAIARAEGAREGALAGAGWQGQRIARRGRA